MSQVVLCVGRWGPADASGQTYVSLHVDPARFQFFSTLADFHAGRPS